MERRHGATFFVGSKARLIALGICNERHFPPGRNRINYPGRHGPSDPMTPGNWDIKLLGGGMFRFIARTPPMRGQAPYWPEAWRTGGGAVDITPRDEEAEAKEAAMKRSFDETTLQIALGKPCLDALQASHAVFRVGDKAMHCLNQDDAGEEVTIVEGFTLHRVQDEGPRLGYVVEFNDGNKFFAAAHRLLEPDYSVRHLRLVKS